MLKIEPDTKIAPWRHSWKALSPSRCSQSFGIDDDQRRLYVGCQFFEKLQVRNGLLALGGHVFVAVKIITE